ncbi:ribonuclease III [Macrococcus armenti]|uniref:ribonuclease III n=1 Tax=Macrococcus armenti TaxID=2875764 RepID=UPI001CCE4C74|nr:ribonuclease III [Macrococcus armenti]UBH09527.1 ribonuclease III [Macrococcus armenti]UBH11805.1 ribonuclease III [Macrococcus armenti]UBH16280.1 ribonuclease III [Macrococcus armenti]UBH18638.1 ribonuclease III [Macrococcus armenti]UBH20908.1 ribonuclease III [Macrococcus armenti]
MNKRQIIIDKFKLRLNETLLNLNIKPKQIELYIQAFSHSSFINDFKLAKVEDNERLEFLGDAVLELMVSQYLFQKHPDIPEGKLTKLRAAIVCEPSLVTFAKLLNFDQLILLGKGEEKTGGRTRPSLIADAFEAFVGALYLDQGHDMTKQFFDYFIFPEITEELMHGLIDYKTYLQEYIHKLKNLQVTYHLIKEEGPAHFKTFTSEVRIEGEMIGIGAGRTKKESEQKAAQAALNLLTSGE